MSAQPLTLAQRRELLVMRSALCRLRLRRATHGVRSSVGLRRGFGTASRFMMLAGRLLVAAKLARSLLGFVRARRG
jgi:hypothetical protein